MADDKPGVDTVALGDPKVETSNFDRYKGRKNVTDRIAILSSKLVRGYRYYHNKKSFLAPTNPEVLKLCKEQLGEPDQYFALVVFHYQTDEDGALLVEEKCQGKVKIWRWSESKYDEYSALQKQWPIMEAGFDAAQHDLLIKCTEEQYQRMTTTVCPKAHWKSKEAWHKALLEKRAKADEKLKGSLGLSLSDQEILDLLGASLASQTGGTENAADVDLSDVVDDMD